MKGYVTASGYMGLVGEEYMLFASEGDYMEYLEGEGDPRNLLSAY